jgi:hypothetical protein
MLRDLSGRAAERIDTTHAAHRRPVGALSPRGTRLFAGSLATP